ncbi:uncharacterized mitochondrial protein AtMg00810-like [Beta vulgaris subsp. vulgaris]|uniref:uncharacterized mitochondrial protein AtMg00810-like n=1 Tax=Beta vulgaris subsp. vulgaris TaxID=3555 RepID=UPI0020375EB8|nr:uncharacterized mitochondrial protein AtMg00810-like [Beta vulgaris subsp. vulgaris]
MTKEIEALELNHTWNLVPLPPGKKLIGSNWVQKVKLKANNGDLKRCKASPVVKMGTVRTLIAVAASKQCPLFQLDVNNAFLHGNLNEEVFMKVHEIWVDICIATIYVDNIVLTSTNVEKLVALKQHLHKEFSIKDLGRLNYFLGIEVGYTSNGILLSQHKYTKELLADCPFDLTKKASTPLPLNIKLQAVDGETTHLAALSHTLKYASHTLGQGTLLRATDQLCLQAFSNSDWASCPDSRKSITGYILLLGGSPITWKSKKQSTISKSSSEAEYRAMAAAALEVTWAVRLLEELGICNLRHVVLHCDNQSALHTLLQICAKVSPMRDLLNEISDYSAKET